MYREKGIGIVWNHLEVWLNNSNVRFTLKHELLEVMVSIYRMMNVGNSQEGENDRSN